MLIEYKNVNIYQDEKKILSNVNFEVNEGEFIYIIGKVGSGKSSLLKTFYCELDIDKDDADHAEVLEQNIIPIKRSKIPALRKQMGIIFQDFQLLHDRSVWKNLRFVLKATGWKDKNEINERIEEVLKQVDMLDKKDKMPHELSGGEQQRIAIARAILNKPRIIIADEPTGNLDPETANNIVTLLREICETGAAVVMTTHNVSLLNEFHGIVYRCKDGQINNITDDFYNKEENQDIDFGLEEEEEEEEEENAKEKSDQNTEN